MADRVIEINCETTNGRVYASELFLELCEHTTMEVGVKRGSVSYSGTEAQLQEADRIVAEFKKRNGEIPQ
jgi:hypothetical protein